VSYDLLALTGGSTSPEPVLREVLATLDGDPSSTVRVDVAPRGPFGWPCDAPPADWGVYVSSTPLGRTPMAAWLQFAVPYHLLILLSDTAVHDCQHHDRGWFNDAEEYRGFAGVALRALTRQCTLRDAGCVDDRGLPVF
jgi:hypothetical protein